MRVGGVSLKEEGSLWNPRLNAKYFTIEFHYYHVLIFHTTTSC